MKSDIEIARTIKLKPIQQIAKKLKVKESDLVEPLGWESGFLSGGHRHENGASIY